MADQLRTFFRMVYKRVDHSALKLDKLFV